MNMEEIKEKVLSEYKKGNIVLAAGDGLSSCPIKQFISQPAEGMLYDLNRGEAVVLTFLDDPKWINDYAVGKVIIELKKQIDELKDEGLAVRSFIRSKHLSKECGECR